MSSYPMFLEEGKAFNFSWSDLISNADVFPILSCGEARWLFSAFPDHSSLRRQPRDSLLLCIKMTYLILSKQLSCMSPGYSLGVRVLCCFWIFHLSGDPPPVTGVECHKSQ